ncbi:hypothetical protein KY362_04895 [Candidatus Woesearchaeota archaeon]|nr:hypothetical protein [Candidatus Woesearchaeota archaeon]
MRKLILKSVVVFIVLLLAAALIAGCAKEESGKKLASRPVPARQTGVQAPPQTEVVYESSEAAASAEEVESPAAPSRPAYTPKAGEAECEQLSLTDLATVMGGSWAKTAECPEHHAMPGGVTVCLCAYDGPKNVYVNVEVQKYDSDAEAQKVFSMYCDESSESAGVGTDSCVREKMSTTSPNYVYVYTPGYFLKVSCLGGSCPFSQLSELAGIVEAGV